MSDKVHNSLSSFMKKQISEKSSKNSSAKSSLFSGESKDGEDKKEKTEEELEQEKALEEAKKTSRNKAAEQDQSGMYKKMLLENVLKYGFVIIAFSFFSFAVMKSGPIAAKFFGGLIHNLVMGVFK